MKKNLIIFISILSILCLVTGCGNKSDDKNDNEIIDIDISNSRVIALNNKNELYVIGNASYAGLGKGVEQVTTPTKMATNVKKFYGGSNSTIYIDFNNDMYYTGLKIETGGGVNDDFKFLKSNVNQVQSYAGLCILISDVDNKLYGITSSSGFCGLSSKYYDEFKYLADDVKELFLDGYNSGYINQKGELFVSSLNGSDVGFKKILDNVKKVFYKSVKGNYYILTYDGILYSYSLQDKTLTKITENVVDIGKETMYFENSQGYIYVIYDRQSTLTIKDEIPGFARLKFDNVKKVIYNEFGKYIYINDDNKIEMHSEYDSYVLDNTIDSMEQILKFVSI